MTCEAPCPLTAIKPMHPSLRDQLDKYLLRWFLQPFEERVVLDGQIGYLLGNLADFVRWSQLQLTFRTSHRQYRPPRHARPLAE